MRWISLVSMKLLNVVASNFFTKPSMASIERRKTCFTGDFSIYDLVTFNWCSNYMKIIVVQNI